MLKTTSKEILKRLQKVFPQFTPNKHKGQNGRIAVIGGSFQFTGAPYYSAVSALKVGGDLSHIFCSKSSSPSIKSYTPQIIVHPVFVSQEQVKYTEQEIQVMVRVWLEKIKAWEKAIHSWVIGPGLGRDKYMDRFFPLLVKNLPQNCRVIFDADAIYYLSQHPQLYKEFKRFNVILTPNKKEIQMLQKNFKIYPEKIFEQIKPSNEEIEEISNEFAIEDCTLIVKGHDDLILSKDHSYIVRTQSGKKRCGGLGDILTGSIAACRFWDQRYGPVLASKIVRTATKVAFEKQWRGTTAPCVLKEVAGVVKDFQNLDLDK